MLIRQHSSSYQLLLVEVQVLEEVEEVLAEEGELHSMARVEEPMVFEQEVVRPPIQVLEAELVALEREVAER